MCVTAAVPEGKGTAEQAQGTLAVPRCRHQRAAAASPLGKDRNTERAPESSSSSEH